MENTPLKILSREEETVVKKLAEIHNAIADGRIELDKVTKSLETAYKDRQEAEMEAMEDLYRDSQEILNKINENYNAVTAMNTQAQQTFQTIKLLANTIDRASQTIEIKTEQLIKYHQNASAENTAIKNRLDAQAKQLNEKEKGLEAFNQDIIKRATMVESQVESLKAITK